MPVGLEHSSFSVTLLVIAWVFSYNQSELLLDTLLFLYPVTIVKAGNFLLTLYFDCFPFFQKTYKSYVPWI